MIYIERVAMPPKYAKRAETALEKLSAFYQRDGAKPHQRHPPSQPEIIREAKNVLINSFKGKCGYCESLAVTGNMWVDCFRPKSHYWWLTYDWENLIVSCQACDLFKGDRFPLEDESRRATKADETKGESALLINPCADWPDSHLVFTENGTVYSDTKRGQATIDTLGLNREALVAARRNAIETIRQSVDVLNATGDNIHLSVQAAETIRRLTRNDAPYSAASRQLAYYMLESQLKNRQRSQLLHSLFAELGEKLKISGWIKKDASAAKMAYQKHEQELESFSVSNVEPRSFSTSEAKRPVTASSIPSLTSTINADSARYYAKRRIIARVKIKNFKAIRNLDICFASAPANPSSWLMLLGENATGKSSILKAVALTLMGNEERQKLNISPNDVLTRGTKDGFIQIWMSGVLEPIELRYKAGENLFTGEAREKVLLL